MTDQRSGKSQPGSLSGLVSKLLIKRTIRAVSVRRQLMRAKIGRLWNRRNRLLAGNFAPIRGLYFGIGPVVFYGNLETTPAGAISTYTCISSATTQNPKLQIVHFEQFAQGSTNFSNIFKYFQTFHTTFRIFSNVSHKFSIVFERFCLTYSAQTPQPNTPNPVFTSKTLHKKSSRNAPSQSFRKLATAKKAAKYT